MTSLLLIDDEQDWLQGISRTLTSHKVASRKTIFTASNKEEATRILQQHEIDLVLLDLYLGNVSGEDLLEWIASEHSGLSVVMMTGANSVETAVSCMKKGAMDYFVKSTPVPELMANLRRILKIIELQRENTSIKKQAALSLAGYTDFRDYITCSPQMFRLFDYIKAAAGSPQHILITGESGVGKGVLARLIARMARPDRALVTVNVAGYDELMFADALFGHTRGAFTGADTTRPGMVNRAADGVLFLDEIGDLSMPSQIKLLHLLQDGQYHPLGSDLVETSKAKFIFASNKDLALQVREGTFRSDLFFRLNAHRVHIPPLSARKEDIPLLADYFAKEAARELSKPVPTFTDGFITRLCMLRLPGNIRQLRAIIYDLVTRHSEIIDTAELAAMKEQGDFMEEAENAPPVSRAHAGSRLPTVDEMTNQLVLDAIQQAGGNQIKAAQMLGISQPTLSRRLKRIKSHNA